MTTDNNRVSSRMRVLKSAKLIALNGWSVVDCKVRDLSETGAKLICGDQAAVPGEFQFLMQSDNTIRNARVVWRKADQLGIEFTSEKAKAPPQKFQTGII